MTASQALIGAVSPAEVPALAALRADNEEGGSSAERMSRYLAGEYHPRFALPARGMWAARIDTVPVGFVAGHLSVRHGCAGEVQWLYVVERHRRSGIASALLRMLAEWFADATAHRICVNASAPGARQFYGYHGAVAIDDHWMVWDDMRVMHSRFAS